MSDATYDLQSASHLRALLGVPVLRIYETIGSTNDAARALADSGAETLSTVLANEQTLGRGRGGKSWLSAPGASLIVSIVFQTPRSQSGAPGPAPVRIGNAVAKAIEQSSKLAARIKWPNDVVIEGKGKVCGILCESSIRQEGIAYIIAGIGVNVGHVSDVYPSINQAAAQPIDRVALLRAVIDNLRPHADQIIAPLSNVEIAEISQRDVLLDQEVETDDGTRGVARGILPDGSLQVETRQGMKAVHTATVRLAQSGAYPGAQK